MHDAYGKGERREAKRKKRRGWNGFMDAGERCYVVMRCNV